MCTMDYPKFIVSNQKEEFISIQRVKGDIFKKLAMIFTELDGLILIVIVTSLSCFKIANI